MSKNSQNKSNFLDQVEKINSEVITLTYGSLMVRLIKDYEKPEEINDQLEKMGYNIGIRLIDDFLAKSCIDPPKTFEEAISIITNNALKFYLNVGAKYELVKTDGNMIDNNQQYEYRIFFSENPLNDYVELPDKFKGLWYSNMICGVIRGALEAINIKVECKYYKDTLKGNDLNEIRVKLIEIIEEKLQEEEQ
jgi:hypothetical protein